MLVRVNDDGEVERGVMSPDTCFLVGENIHKAACRVEICLSSLYLWNGLSSKFPISSVPHCLCHVVTSAKRCTSNQT